MKGKKLLFIGDLSNIHLLRWVKAFIDKGYKIKVLSSNPPVKEDLEGYEIDYLLIPGLYSNSRRLFLLTLVKLRTTIFLFKPEIIHVHFMPSTFAGFFYLAGLRNLVISVWGIDIVYDTIYKPEPLRLIKFKKAILRCARSITATSKFLKQETLKYYPKESRIEVIPFGIEVEKFKPKKKFLSGDKVIISFIKHLLPKYGPEYLLETFSRVIASYPGAKLYMAGDGSLKKHLIDRSKDLGIEDKVNFLGHISHNDVLKLLNKTDIFVMPSIYNSETFGVAALEASAMGVPVIASRVGGVPEVIRNGETGLLVEKENVKELTNAILKLVSNRDLWRKMSVEGRNFVLENFVWEKNVERMEMVYKRLLS